MRLSKEAQEAIAAAVQRATAEALEMYDERYVTGEELCNRICMFTPDWLKRYGERLPRTRIYVNDDDGKQRKTSWGYPLHHILRRIREGHTYL